MYKVTIDGSGLKHMDFACRDSWQIISNIMSGSCNLQVVKNIPLLLFCPGKLMEACLEIT
jgi:hypothetical protein